MVGTWGSGGRMKLCIVYSGASEIRQLSVLSLKRRDQCGEIVALYNLHNDHEVCKHVQCGP